MTEILVTGGAGYIGSHMCVELLQAGYRVVVLDNLSNSSANSLEAVQRITQKNLTFVKADLRDADTLRQVFDDHDISAVLHFAGLKAVGESVARPLHYYDNNVNGTLQLIQAMTAANVKTLVFSSSATVYGMPDRVPIAEDFPTGPINPYGRTKLQIEDMLRDLQASDPDWRISLLRYFNPVGAHASGEIGEDPNDIPNNLMPYIAQVAVRQASPPARFRQRLPDARRNRCAGLHPCSRPCPWPSESAGVPGSTPRDYCSQPGYWNRLFGTRRGAGIRAGQRAADSLPDHRTPSGRRRRVLRRSGEGERRAGLAGAL